MIHAKEFMIGNYVMDEVSGEWMVIDEIGKNIGATVINRDKFPLADGWQMTGIPLTPEILERCGFIKQTGTRAKPDATYFDIVNNVYRIYIDNKYCSIHLNADAFWFPKLTELQTLHQLQNLYYTLTGAELTIKEL